MLKWPARLFPQKNVYFFDSSVLVIPRKDFLKSFMTTLTSKTLNVFLFLDKMRKRSYGRFIGPSSFSRTWVQIANNVQKPKHDFGNEENEYFIVWERNSGVALLPRLTPWQYFVETI